MAPCDLLWACREAAAELELVGADIVEVIPTAVGSTDITAPTADRIVREMLTGIALRRAPSLAPLLSRGDGVSPGQCGRSSRA